MRITWNVLDEREWTAAMPAHQASLQQSWGYGQTLLKTGACVHRAAVIEGSDILALAQCVLSKKWGVNLALCSRGPVWRYGMTDALKHQAMELIRASNPSPFPAIFIATPHDIETPILPLISNFYTAELNLNWDRKVMRNKMRGKWRNRLRKAESSGLQVKAETGMNWLQQLLAREELQQQRLRYKNLPAALYTSWAQSRPQDVTIYRAIQNGDTIAAMLFLDHAPRASYQIGWSTEEGRKRCAHNLLLWRAMRDFAELGRHSIDLGMLNTRDAPGLARFKLGSGAVAREIGASGLVLPRLRRKWRLPIPQFGVSRA